MDANSQASQDAEHLRLLSIFHFVVAGMQALFACFPIIHFAIGALSFFGMGPFGKAGEGRLPGMLFGGVFMLFAGGFILAGWSLAACLVVAGKSLRQRKRYTFCLVVAGIEAAMCMPFGTVLGVFTIIVLLRPSVKAEFGAT
jgi:hypothetical protein